MAMRISNLVKNIVNEKCYIWRRSTVKRSKVDTTTLTHFVHYKWRKWTWARFEELNLTSFAHFDCGNDKSFKISHNSSADSWPNSWPVCFTVGVKRHFGGLAPSPQAHAWHSHQDAATGRFSHRGHKSSCNLSEDRTGQCVVDHARQAWVATLIREWKTSAACSGLPYLSQLG